MFASSRVDDPLSAFLLLIEPFEKDVVEMTNLYGSRRHKANWKPVDIVTMRAYYGLLLLAGVYRSHGECMTELWNDYDGRPIFRATMALKTFKMINQCIRFDDREVRLQGEARDKLAPIRNIFEKWVHRQKMSYIPGKNVTVDEQLVPFRGRCPFTQYMPSKPAKYGMKIWVLCDSDTYYAYNLEMYVGRNRNCQPEVNQGEHVVLTLTEGLNGRNVTCDNFFTSHSLATELKKRQMTIVGTVRKNRKELPPALITMKSKPPLHSEFLFDHKLRATVVSYVPKKNRFVTLLSTMHLRKEVDPGPKKKPEIINCYNATKGAVDTLDEMVGTYRCKRKVLRWSLAAFENMLDIAALNAFVIYTELNPYWKYTQKKIRRRLFLVEIGKSLVQPYIEKRKRLPRGSSASDMASDIRFGFSRENSPSAASVSSIGSIASPIPGLQRLTHLEPAKKRARCHLCPYSSSGTSYAARCDNCHKSICQQHKFNVCEKCCGVDI